MTTIALCTSCRRAKNDGEMKYMYQVVILITTTANKLNTEYKSSFYEICFSAAGQLSGRLQVFAGQNPILPDIYMTE